jgi:hypothetical protein
VQRTMLLKKRLRARQLVNNKSSKALLPREVYVLSVVAFFVALGYGMIIPAIPLFAKTFEVNNAQIGAIISAFALARFAMGLPAGKLIDLFGERRVQTAGLLIVAISTFASGLANSYWQLLTYRALGGIGSVMFSVSASSLLMRSVDDSIRGRAQSTFNGAGYRFESYGTGVNNRGAVLSTGLNNTIKFGGKVSLLTDLQFLPSMKDFADYRFVHDSALEFPIATGFWKLRVGLNNQFNSRPQPGRDELDNTYYTRFVLNWK